jgi:hypothetical protein
MFVRGETGLGPGNRPGERLATIGDHLRLEGGVGFGESGEEPVRLEIAAESERPLVGPGETLGGLDPSVDGKPTGDGIVLPGHDGPALHEDPGRGGALDQKTPHSSTPWMSTSTLRRITASSPSPRR